MSASQESSILLAVFVYRVVQHLAMLAPGGPAAAAAVEGKRCLPNQSPAGDLFAGATICRVRSWMSAWVFLLLGGMDSIVFGPIRWCVWSFRLSSPLRLPHLKKIFFVVFFFSLLLNLACIAAATMPYERLFPKVLLEFQQGTVLHTTWNVALCLVSDMKHV